MAQFQGDKFVLTAVVPVTDVRNRMFPLATWLHLAQTYPLRVALILDSSDADEIEIFEQFVTNLNSDHLISRIGSFNSPGLARNKGMSEVKTPLIAFWDSDDLPNLSNVFDLIDESIFHDEILIGQYVILKNAISEAPLFTSNDLDLIGVVCKNLGLWRMIFPTQLLKGKEFSQYRMAEDQLFFAILEISQLRYRFSKEVLYSYVDHSGSRLTKNRKAIEDLVPVLQKLLAILAGQENKARRVTILIILRLAMSSFHNLPMRYLPKIMLIIGSLIFQGRYTKDVVFGLKKILQTKLGLK
jgi:glycosyltransferase involved in cell wall biosynthesis